MASKKDLQAVQEALPDADVTLCFRADLPVRRQMGRIFFGALGALIISSLRGSVRYYLLAPTDNALFVLPMPRRADAAPPIMLRGAELRAVSLKSGLFRSKISIDTPTGQLRLRVPGMAAHSTARAGLDALKQLCAQAQPA